MNVLNVMLSHGQGGLEQASLDYHCLAADHGHNVLSIFHAKFHLPSSGLIHKSSTQTIFPLNEYDFFAIRKLAKLASHFAPSIVLCHGNRAIGLTLRARRMSLNKFPIVGIAHNDRVAKRFPRCDAAFYVSPHLASSLVRSGLAENQIYLVPNFVRLGEVRARPEYRNPVVIGSLGRLSRIKQVDLLVESLRVLKGRGITPQVHIGGAGEEEGRLRRLVKNYNLQNQIEFKGWITNKDAFYSDIDIFVLPSRDEAFSITLIEAMGREIPCISTDTPGPRNILSPNTDGIIVPNHNPDALADAIERLANDKSFAMRLGQHAREKIETHYTPTIAGEMLNAALVTVDQNFANK